MTAPEPDGTAWAGPITDAQVHVWQRSTPDRPWPAGKYLPTWADDPMDDETLIARMDEAGVRRAVLVPPSFEGDRNDLSLQAAARFPDRLAVMGRISMQESVERQRLPRWRETPGMLGLRLTLFLPEDRVWLRERRGDWLWQEAERHRLPLMVFPDPDDVHLIGDVAERFPGLRLIVDHLAIGREEWRRDDRAFDHLDGLLMLSRFPNVAVKASGLPEYSTDPFPFRNLHAYVRRVVDAFTPSRVLWGSDLSRLPCTYRQAVGMFTEEMPWLTPADLESIMGDSACRWLDWPLA